MRTAAEAAAAVEQADYEGLIAEKEKEMKQSEAEEEKRRGQALAQYQRDVPIMSVNKRVVVAKAKLKAIQESIVEGYLGDPPNFPDMDITECLERTVAWVNTSSPIKENVTPPPGHPGYTPEDGHAPGDRHTPSDGNTPKGRITALKGAISTEIPETTVNNVNTQRRVYPNRLVWGPEQSTPAQKPPSYYPPSGLVTPSGLYSSVPLEKFTAFNPLTRSDVSEAEPSEMPPSCV